MKPLGLCLMMSACGFSQAQPALSPEEAVERALRSNPLVAAQRSRIEAAESLQRQAALRPNPRLFLQSENSRFGSERSPFRYSQDTDTFAYAGQRLEGAGKRDSRVFLAGEIVKRRQYEEASERAEISRRVLNAYWAAVGAERVREVLQSNLSNLEQTVKYHRDRVKEGALAEVDLVRVELEREQVAIQYGSAEADRQRLRMQLFREIGEEEQAGTALSGELQAVQAFIAPSIEESLTRRTDLQLARQIVEQTKASTRLEQSNAKPDSEVLFGYKRTAGFNTVIAGAQFDLPLRNRNQGAIAASIAEQRAAGHELDAATLAARNEILSAQREYDQKLTLATSNLPRIRAQAADTVQIARAVYREGAADLLRLLDAERTSLQVELLYVRTLVEYQLALANLRAATGMLP